MSLLHHFCLLWVPIHQILEHHLNNLVPQHHLWRNLSCTEGFLCKTASHIHIPHSIAGPITMILAAILLLVSVSFMLPSFCLASGFLNCLCLAEHPLNPFCPE